jgi:hypothetical protein
MTSNFYNIKSDNDENFQIDPEAKITIDLIRHLDSDKQPFYTGKLQFPGTLNFSEGVSFMVFISESGVEQLQIGPSPIRTKMRRRNISLSNGRFNINLHSMKDRDLKTYYIGEVLGPGELQIRNGLFFTIFLSKSGYEEIQISCLQHHKRDKVENYD